MTINGTLKFLRDKGMDRLVDGYGIYYYPDEKRSAAQRKKDLEELAVTQYKPVGQAGGKPC